MIPALAGGNDLISIGHFEDEREIGSVSDDLLGAQREACGLPSTRKAYVRHRVAAQLPSTPAAISARRRAGD